MAGAIGGCGKLKSDCRWKGQGLSGRGQRQQQREENPGMHGAVDGATYWYMSTSVSE